MAQALKRVYIRACPLVMDTRGTVVAGVAITTAVGNILVAGLLRDVARWLELNGYRPVKGSIDAMEPVDEAGDEPERGSDGPEAPKATERRQRT